MTLTQTPAARMPADPLRRRWGLAGAAWLLAPRVHALQVAGHSYADTMTVDGVVLRLNGAGVRSQLWFKAFTVALYLPHQVRQANAVLNQHGVKRLRLRMLVNVPAEEFAKALRRGVQKNHSAEEQLALAARLQSLAAQVRDMGELHTGDAVDLDMQPAQGLVMSLNGTPRGVPLPGEDLYNALLRIFIGERPVQQALKDALLSGSPN